MLLNNAGTRPSNCENDVTAGGGSYFGGADDATAFSTVVRELPNRSAICFFGTPSAASLRINARSSKVITLQPSSSHSSTVATDQFRASSTRDHHLSLATPNAIMGLVRRSPWISAAWVVACRDAWVAASLLAANGWTHSGDRDRSPVDRNQHTANEGCRSPVDVRRRSRRTQLHSNLVVLAEVVSRSRHRSRLSIQQRDR